MLALPVQGRAAQCVAPEAVTQVSREFALLSPTQNTVSAAQAQRLSALMARVREAKVLAQLQDARLEALEGITLDLLAEAHDLSRPAARYDPLRIEAMLQELSTITRLACESRGDGVTGDLPSDLYGLYTEGRVDWDEVDRYLRDHKTVAGGAVVGVMALVIGALFAGDLLVRWIWALVYNRRACRVVAQLSLEGVVYPGLLVTLGRGGFRFVPDALWQVDDVLGATAVLSLPGDQKLSGTLSRAQEMMADFRLERPLSLRQQAEILQHSTVSPFYIRKSRGSDEAQMAAILHGGPSKPVGQKARTGQMRQAG